MEQSEQIMVRTPTHRLRDALHVSDERLELILRGSNDGFWDWNVGTAELYLAPRWLEMLGYAEGELEPHIRTMENVCHPDDLPSLREALRAQLEGSGSQVMEIEHRVRTKSGDWKWFLTRGTAGRRDEHAKVSRIAGTATDITDRRHAEEELREHRDLLDEMVAQRTLELAEAIAELEFDIVKRKQAEKELQESNTMLTETLEREQSISTQLKEAKEQLETYSNELERLVHERTADLESARNRLEDLARELAKRNSELALQARVDPLTKLLNRTAWDESADREQERSQRCNRSYSIVMIDVDHFKAYNDSQGHQAGDECLRRVARSIASVCRTTECVGRYGGEEFVVLVPETNLEGGRLLAERIRGAIAEMNISHPASPTIDRVTVSVGVASSAVKSWVHLLTEADDALYSAKKIGRNQVCVAQTTLRHV